MTLLGLVAAGVVSPPPTPTYTTWDPAKKAADVILSSANLRAETNDPSGGGSVLSVLGLSSGKYYFEVQPDQLYGSNPGFLTGISVGTGTEGSFCGAGSDSFGLASRASDSGTYTASSQTNVNGSGASSTSEYHRIAVDVDAGKLWFAISNRASGAWIGGGDPAVGTSPTYSFAPGSTVYAMACPRRGDAGNPSDRNRLVAKFDPASWSGTPPAGFGGWTDDVPSEPPVLAVYNSSTPTTDSAIPAPVLGLIDEYLDITWTGQVEWTNQSGASAFTLWSLDDGDHRMYFDSDVDGAWKLVVNGGVVCTANPIITTEGAAQNSMAGQFVTARAWWDEADGTCGIQIAVNGVYAYEQVNSAAGTPIVTPATGYLNSISGGSPSTEVTQIAFQVNSRTASRVQSFNGAALGDSTVASYTPGAGVPVASLLRSAIDSRNSAFKSLAIGGATIDDQAAQWAAFTEKADLRWIVIQVGLNDIDPAEAAGPAIARLQDLVDDVNASKPAGAKVYIATMIPCYARMVTRYGAGAPADASYAKWQAMNEAIAGLGGSPITDVDGRITAHTPLMDDGSGNLAAAYDTGDGIHPNNAGRQVIANAWKARLQADGML